MLILNFEKAINHILKHKFLCVPKVFVFYLSGKRYAFLGKITGYSDGKNAWKEIQLYSIL